MGKIKFLLTLQEFDVLNLLIKGCSVNQIADITGYSRSYVRELQDKGLDAFCAGYEYTER